MERAAPKGYLVTANKLTDGGVVYLAQSETWTSSIDSALTFDDAEERDRWVAWGKGRESEVCGCYGIEVVRSASGARVLSMRERLRAEGAASARARLGYLDPSVNGASV